MGVTRAPLVVAVPAAAAEVGASSGAVSVDNSWRFEGSVDAGSSDSRSMRLGSEAARLRVSLSPPCTQTEVTLKRKQNKGQHKHTNTKKNKKNKPLQIKSLRNMHDALGIANRNAYRSCVRTFSVKIKCSEER